MTIGFMVFHFLRHFPAWAGWLPAHKPSETFYAADGGPERAP